MGFRPRYGDWPVGSDRPSQQPCLGPAPGVGVTRSGLAQPPVWLSIGVGMLEELSPELRDSGAKPLGLSEPVSSCVMWGHSSCQHCLLHGVAVRSQGPS